MGQASSVLMQAQKLGIKVVHISEFRERYIRRAPPARVGAASAGGWSGAGSGSASTAHGAVGHAGGGAAVRQHRGGLASAGAGSSGLSGKGKGRAVAPRITERDYEPLGPYHLKIEDGSGLYRPIIGIWPPDEHGNPT